jgi:ribosomal protein S18 acetylase RimI-like enzyme
VVRAARADDREAILALWLDLIEHHRRLSPEHASAPNLREVLASEIARGSSRARCRLLVAERGARRIGFLFAEVEASGSPGDDAGAGWIHELWVAPDERERGAANALLAEAEAFFAASSVRRVSVRVESGNADALRYWARRGFGDRARILERVT